MPKWLFKAVAAVLGPPALAFWIGGSVCMVYAGWETVVRIFAL